MLYLKWCAKHTIYGQTIFSGPEALRNISGQRDTEIFLRTRDIFSGPEITISDPEIVICLRAMALTGHHSKVQCQAKHIKPVML